MTAPSYQQFIFESVKETRSDETMPESQQQRKKQTPKQLKTLQHAQLSGLVGWRMEDRNTSYHQQIKVARIHVAPDQDMATYYNI